MTVRETERWGEVASGEWRDKGEERFLAPLGMTVRETERWGEVASGEIKAKRDSSLRSE